MKSKHLLASFLILSFVLIYGLQTSNRAVEEKYEQEGRVRINEVIPKNDSLMTDAFGDYVDLIELYNSSKEEISLLGYGLSDDPAIPHKWQFSDVRIGAGQYLVVYAAIPNDHVNDLGLTIDQELYTGFKLSAEGERIALSGPEGNLLDLVVYEPLKGNMSIGYMDDAYTYFLKGTPGRENEGTAIADLENYYLSYRVIGDHTAGIYHEPFDLKLTTNGEDELRYTLDGSDPTITSPLYDEAIRIDDGRKKPMRIAQINSTFYGPVPVSSEEVNRGTVVKAQCFNKDIPLGDMFVATYFVWDEKEVYPFEIVSLTTDPRNLFDDQIGIYVVGSYYEQLAPEYVDGSTPANYNQRGRDWEREAHIEWIGRDGTSFFEQHIGIRMFGGWSRANAKKSFRLIAREEYDDDGSFHYPFFSDLQSAEGDPIDTFQSLVLRAGGNDTEYTLFRDSLTNRLAEDITDGQADRPVILFLNGEYWGIYNLREHLDAHYISSHFQLEEDKIAMLVYGTDGAELYEGNEEDLTDYENFLMELDESDLSIDSVYQEYEKKVDVMNLIDYYITQIYVNNVDWPGNNCKIWRYKGDEGKGYRDGRYRFLLYDTEFNFGLYEGPSAAKHDSFSFLHVENNTNWPNPSWSTLIYRKFMENSKFKELMMTRLFDLLNSKFDTNHVLHTIDELKELYKPGMEEYIKRWHYWAIPSVREWEDTQVDQLKTFAKQRKTHLLQYAKDFYKLGEITELTYLRNPQCDVLVNRDYKIDYVDSMGAIQDEKKLASISDYKISLTAQVKENSLFERWIIILEEGNIEINDENYLFYKDYLDIQSDLTNPEIEFYPKENLIIQAMTRKP